MPTCNYCGNAIVFDDKIVSKKGKKIPLEEWNHRPHDCPQNPYNYNNKSQIKAVAISKKPLIRVEDV